MGAHVITPIAEPNSQSPKKLKVLIALPGANSREAVVRLREDLDPDVQLLVVYEPTDTARIARLHADLDLVLLDPSAPGVNGAPALSVLRRYWPSVPVVVMSASGVNPQSGTPYLLGRELLHALVNTLRNHQQSSQGATGAPPSPGGASSDSGSSLRLTRRQRQVLNLMCEGRSNKEIGQHLGMAEGTVKVHVTAILKALNASNRTQAVILAGKMGLEGAG